MDGPELLTADAREALPPPDQQQALPEPEEMTLKQKASLRANENIDQTASLVRGWVHEGN